jgi:hypothetical protein
VKTIVGCIVVGIGGGDYTDEWMNKATTLLDCAFSLSKIVWCTCSRCYNTRCLEDKITIIIHLCKNDFIPGYEVWKFHGESGTRVVAEVEHGCDARDVDKMNEMLEAIHAEINEDPPTTEVEVFFKFLKASEEPFYEHIEMTLLTFINCMMTIKSKYFFFNNCYNDLMKLINDIRLKPHKVAKA